MDGITEIKEKSKFEKAVGLFFKNSERVSFVILLLWCALPVFMVVLNLILGLSGDFPTEIPEGLTLGHVIYIEIVDIYFNAFRIVGFITLVYAVLAAAVSYKRIFSKAGFFNQPWLYFFTALIIWSVVSTLLSDDPYFAFVGGNYMHNGLLSYFFYGALFVCASMITDKKLRRIIMLVFFGVLSLLCVIMILQSFNIYFVLYCFPSNGSAVFNNSNHFGYVLCIGVAAAAGMFLFGAPHEPEMARKSGTEGGASLSEGGGSALAKTEGVTPSVALREPPTLSSSRRGTPTGDSSLGEGALPNMPPSLREVARVSETEGGASLSEGGGSALAETEGVTPSVASGDSSLKEGASKPSPTGEGTPSVSSPEGGACKSASLSEGGGSALAETEGVNGSGDRSPTTVCASFTVGEGSPLPNSEFRIQNSESNRSAEQISALSYSKRALINKIISLCFLILFTVTLLINNTFGAFIGASFGIAAAYVFYFVRRGKVRWYVFLPVVIFIALTVLNSVKIIPSATPIISDITKTAEDVQKIVANDPNAGRAGSSRWVLWKNAFQRVLERPIFGFGPEGFYGEHALDSQNTGTHNEYLEMAGYLGIPALLLYLTALILIVIKQWKNLKGLDPLVVAAAGGSVAYLVSAFVGAPVFNTFPFFCMFLGFTSIGVTEPVICLKNTEAKKQLFANAKKKYVIIAIVALIAVICTVFAVIMANLVRQTEKTSETADMHCMNGAIKTVALRLKDNVPDEPTDYWYDANSLSLIPVSEEKPMPYGMGTALKGGASADFASEFGSDFGYDEGTDYTDKIIKLTVSKNDEDKLDVKMEWVQGRKK